MLRMLTSGCTALMALGLVAGPAKGSKTIAALAADHILSGTQKDVSRTLDDTKVPYTVSADYFVDSGSELVVKPGVTLVFAKNAGLTVQGSLKMEGTAENPIVCKGSSSGIGVWQGIKVCSKAAADIEGVSISGAKEGLHLDDKVDVRKCSICKNEIGIVSKCNHYTFEDLYVCDNRGDAIQVGHPTLDHCTISRNGGNGLCGWGGCDVTGSVITKNKKAGINCWNGGHDVTVNGSYLEGNKQYDIHNGCGKTWDCKENYWGPAVTKMLEQKGDSVNLPRIYDRKDKPDAGLVNVSEWLKEMPAECGAREYPGMPKKK